MALENAKRDNNRIPTLLGASNDANLEPRRVLVDPTTNAVLVQTVGTGSGTTPVVGNVASGATDSGNPVKTGGVYNTSAPTLTNGQRGDTQMDTNANTLVTLATKLSGEDQTNDVMKVEQQFSYTRITTATTTTVKSGAGFLHAIVFGKHVATETLINYDNTAGSGTIIYKYTEGAAILSDNQTLIVDAKFGTGLTVVTDQATDVTYIWR